MKGNIDALILVLIVRLSITDVCNHIYFWNTETKLEFLKDLSDRLEFEDMNHALVVRFEELAVQRKVRYIISNYYFLTWLYYYLMSFSIFRFWDRKWIGRSRWARRCSKTSRSSVSTSRRNCDRCCAWFATRPTITSICLFRSGRNSEISQKVRLHAFPSTLHLFMWQVTWIIINLDFRSCSHFVTCFSAQNVLASSNWTKSIWNTNELNRALNFVLD